MKISLENSLAYLEVNTNGAYIDKFEVKSKAVFFPKVMVKIGEILKVRGGMHICAPNFGKDEKINTLPSHGFGRDLLWNLIEKKDNMLKLSLDGLGDYEDVNFILTYKLEKTNLLLDLEIINHSKEEKLIAPGFHPYFYTGQQITIDNKEIDETSLVDSIYIDSKNESFSTNELDIEIKGLKNINKYVYWSDFKGDYICIEPTYNGNAFEDPNKNSYILEEQEKFEMACEIKVNI